MLFLCYIIYYDNRKIVHWPHDPLTSGLKNYYLAETQKFYFFYFCNVIPMLYQYVIFLWRWTLTSLNLVHLWLGALWTSPFRVVFFCCDMHVVFSVIRFFSHHHHILLSLYTWEMKKEVIVWKAWRKDGLIHFKNYKIEKARELINNSLCLPSSATLSNKNLNKIINTLNGWNYSGWFWGSCSSLHRCN